MLRIPDLKAVQPRYYRVFQAFAVALLISGTGVCMIFLSQIGFFEVIGHVGGIVALFGMAGGAILVVILFLMGVLEMLRKPKDVGDRGGP
jgi:hypothetical protein